MEKCDGYITINLSSDKTYTYTYYCELEHGHVGLHKCHADNYCIEWLPKEEFVDVPTITDEVKEECKQKMSMHRLTQKLIEGIDI